LGSGQNLFLSEAVNNSSENSPFQGCPQPVRGLLNRLEKRIRSLSAGLSEIFMDYGTGLTGTPSRTSSVFTGITRPEEFRTVSRTHVIAWRDDLVRRELGGSTVRHRLAALSSLFEYLCEKNAVTHKEQNIEVQVRSFLRASRNRKLST
jgi:hypothetical protein